MAIKYLNNAQEYSPVTFVVKSGSSVEAGSIVALDSDKLVAFATSSSAIGLCTADATGDGTVTVPVLLFDRIPTMKVTWTGSAPSVGDSCDFTAAGGPVGAGSVDGTVISYDSALGEAVVALKPDAVLLV